LYSIFCIVIKSDQLYFLLNWFWIRCTYLITSTWIQSIFSASDDFQHKNVRRTKSCLCLNSFFFLCVTIERNFEWEIRSRASVKRYLVKMWNTFLFRRRIIWNSMKMSVWPLPLAIVSLLSTKKKIGWEGVRPRYAPVLNIPGSKNSKFLLMWEKLVAKKDYANFQTFDRDTFYSFI
jgi:hypothetical protein